MARCVVTHRKSCVTLGVQHQPLESLAWVAEHGPKIQTTSLRQRQLEAIRKVSANICKTNKREKKRKRKEGLWDFFWCGGVIGANRYQDGSIHILNFNFFFFFQQVHRSFKFFWCGCNWIERTGTKTAQKFQINQITLNSKILVCTYK